MLEGPDIPLHMFSYIFVENGPPVRINIFIIHSDLWGHVYLVQQALDIWEDEARRTCSSAVQVPILVFAALGPPGALLPTPAARCAGACNTRCRYSNVSPALQKPTPQQLPPGGAQLKLSDIRHQLLIGFPFPTRLYPRGEWAGNEHTLHPDSKCLRPCTRRAY